MIVLIKFQQNILVNCDLADVSLASFFRVKQCTLERLKFDNKIERHTNNRKLDCFNNSFWLSLEKNQSITVPL